MIEKVLYYSFVLIIVFYVARNPSAFSRVIGSLSSAYSSSVRTLQGR